jgi:hypothetical protein
VDEKTQPGVPEDLCLFRIIGQADLVLRKETRGPVGILRSGRRPIRLTVTGEAKGHQHKTDPDPLTEAWLDSSYSSISGFRHIFSSYGNVLRNISQKKSHGQKLHAAASPAESLRIE